MDLSDLAGRRFGPAHLFVSQDGVADFVSATGDDPDRWMDQAPPGFVSVALFGVAPHLLSMLYEHAVIHGEQNYLWHRPFRIGSELSMTGGVTKVRERGGVHFITFEMSVDDDSGTVATGSALFLAGVQAGSSSSEEREEPAATDRGSLGDGEVSASRSDLVRYAAATRDWNPIHWDHDSAVAAGLPGVVVHGLLQASWVLRKAAEDHILVSARVRFRNPLFPASPVSISLDGTRATLSDGVTDFITATLEYADE